MLKEYISKHFDIIDIEYIPKFKSTKWKNINLGEEFSSDVQKILDKKVPYIPASFYLDYHNTGSREVYQKAYFDAQTDLFKLSLMKCINPEANCISKIIDYVWMFCEMSTWSVPHTYRLYKNRYPDNDKLPDVSRDRIFIDLFSAAMGAELTLVYWLFKDEFDKVSPLVNQRIINEVYKRIVYPYQSYDDFWWMGLSADGTQNNWNPWITSNVLFSTLFLPLKKHEKRLTVNKALLVLDNFINSYKEDGGCDEGPWYFYMAGGALISALELLKNATSGVINALSEPKIQNIGKYVSNMFLFDYSAPNFGDSGFVNKSFGSFDYFVGKAIDDEKTANLGAYRLKLNVENEISWSVKIPWLQVKLFFLTNEALDINVTKLDAPLFSLLSDTEIFTIHENSNCSGFAVAGKAGNNNESHNHNDVGQIIVFKDKKPVIVDLGMGEYTAKTFSADRYEIPLMNSDFHNLPVINGAKQKNGTEYFGKIVDFVHRESETKVSVDIKNAYPNSAKINNYIRTFSLERSRSIFSIVDAFDIEKGEIIMNLFTIGKPKIEKDVIHTKYGCDIMVYGHNSIVANPETLLDDKTKQSWDDEIWHIKVLIQNAMSGKVEFVFK